MKIIYQPTFLRRLHALPKSLQKKVLEKVALFEQVENHKALQVHKLHGRLEGRYRFSITPAIRVVFCYTATKLKETHLLTVGDHTVYDV